MIRVALVALVACSKTAPHVEPDPVPVPVAASDAAIGTESAIPAASQQLVTAVIDSWDATSATLRYYTRDPRVGSALRWQLVGEPWPGVIGATGAAWGDGLHGNGPPAGRSGPRKHEGDRKSPAGAFALTAAYGYAAAPPAGTALPYTAVDDTWICVDDPASASYATITTRDRAGSYKSAEQMRRPDELYTWVVDIAHNPKHVKGDGSCIFLHVWGGADSATVGCTAMAEPQLATLLGKLDAHATPVFVLLPRAEYTALAPAWGLPPL